jgi:anti-sigma factor RsiW
MHDFDDELLVAYLDGELDPPAFARVEAALEADAQVGARLVALSEATALARRAFDDVLHEPVPARLLAAAVVAFPARSAPNLRQRVSAGVNRRPWLSLALAASILGLVIGTPIGYLFGDSGQPAAGEQVASTSPGWLDTLAGYHNLFISSADGAENAVFDVPAGSEKRLPVDIRVPDLKPYNFVFRGARRIILDGKPAYQFFYGAADHHKAALTVFVTTTGRPELPPTFERRDGVNLIYWRHLGHGYAIAGETDKGTMSSLASDIAWQLQAH